MKIVRTDGKRASTVRRIDVGRCFEAEGWRGPYMRCSGRALVDDSDYAAVSLMTGEVVRMHGGTEALPLNAELHILPDQPPSEEN